MKYEMRVFQKRCQCAIVHVGCVNIYILITIVSSIINDINSARTQSIESSFKHRELIIYCLFIFQLCFMLRSRCSKLITIFLTCLVALLQITASTLFHFIQRWN